MKILLFGGTTEGRVLAQKLLALGHAVTVSVATELGAEMLGDLPKDHILTGRLEQPAIAQRLPDYALCIDATHPYAEEVSRHIRKACTKTGVPLRRVLREASREEGCIRVDSCKAAAEYLCDRPGNVLIATGSKALRDYGCLAPERMYPRGLPTHAALTICEEMGIPHRNILALQGPFTLAMNAAMLEQYHISYLVTKDGGTVGGFTEKQQAARQAGAQLILVGRPPDSGEAMEQLLRELEEWA